MKIQTRLLAAAVAFAALAAHAGAQPVRYPERPVKIVVAFAPGGNNDVPMRILAARLTEMWNVAVNVDNRPGAGGIVGTESVANATADGYTLANCNSATHGVNAALHKKLPYDAVKSFAAVALVGSAPNVLLVPATSPIKTAREFIEQAKARPGKLAVATAGIGTTQHFSLELLMAMSNADIIHVPYKGGAPALADVIGGQVPAAITGLPTALAAIKSGKVRALAVTSAERSQHVPELPTIAEAGLVGYEVTTWTGLCAPSATPRAIVEQLSADVARALDTQETRQRLLDAGVEPTYLPNTQLSSLIAREVIRFTKIVESSGMVAEQ